MKIGGGEAPPPIPPRLVRSCGHAPPPRPPPELDCANEAGARGRYVQPHSRKISEGARREHERRASSDVCRWRLRAKPPDLGLQQRPALAAEFFLPGGIAARQLCSTRLLIYAGEDETALLELVTESRL